VNLVLEFMDCGSINTIIKIIKQAVPGIQAPVMPEFIVSRIIAKVSLLRVVTVH
jgi:hypothetical protein